MAKNWIYVILGIVILGMILAVGSISTSPGVSTGNGIAQSRESGTMRTTAIISQNGHAPNFQWDVTTTESETRTAAAIVYTVPAGHTLRVDDLIITNWGSNGSFFNIQRAPGKYLFTTYLEPSEHFEYSFKNVILIPGEKLKLFTSSESPSSAYWQITGLLS